MVSEWMTNGNIKQFVTTHQNANRFELVSCPFKCPTLSVIVYNRVTPAVGRCREGLDLYARPGNDPRGSQRCTSSRTLVSPFLMGSVN